MLPDVSANLKHTTQAIDADNSALMMEGGGMMMAEGVPGLKQ